jgi:hypothetical protein
MARNPLKGKKIKKPKARLGDEAARKRLVNILLIERPTLRLLAAVTRDYKKAARQ